MRCLPLLALGALTALPATAMAEKLPKPELQLQLDEYNINLRDFTFPSGLRVIFQEDHTQPIVSITSVIDRGASHDPLGKEGIAHLVEHLWFRSVHGDLPKVWNVLKEVGANMNASTASDWTNYMTVAPADALIPLLRLEALRMTNAIEGVEEEIVFTEREIVRNELRMRYENSPGGAIQFVREQLYPEGHPYSRLGIGTHDSLNNITLQDVQDFVDSNYRPEYTTIVVVGDFDADEAWRFMQETFPPELLVDPKNPEAPVELIDPPVRVSGVADEPPAPADQSIQYHKAGVEKTTVWMAWSLPGGYRPNVPLMNTTVNMLNFFLPAQFWDDWDPLTDSLDESSSIGCFLWDEEVNSTAMCYIEVGAGKDPEKESEKALNGLYNLWNMNNRPLLTSVFSRARYQSMADVFRSVEVVSSVGSGRATDTAGFTHFTGDAMYYSRMFEWLNTINVHDGAAFAEKYLTRDRVVITVLEPYEDEDILIDSSDAVYKGAVREAETVTMIDLSEINAEVLDGIMVPPDLSEKREFTMANGLRVVVLPYGTAPLVRAELSYDGGRWVEDKTALDKFTFHYMKEDWPNDADPLRLAGSWDGGSSSQGSALGVVGSSANLDGLLYILRQRTDGGFIDVSEKGAYVKSQNKSLRRDRKKEVSWWEGNLVNQRLFPGHEAGFVVDENYNDAMKDLSTADAKAWYSRIVQPANATLYIIGRSDPVQAEQLARTYFEGWEVEGADGKRMPKPEGPPPPPERQIIVFNKDRTSQTGASMRCQIGPATVENFEARQMLAEVIDEQAWLALREQSGVTYGAGSGQAEYPGGAAVLIISSLVQNDGAGLAAETFLRLSDEAAGGKLPEDTLTLMKLSEARNYALGHQTTGQMLNRLSPYYRDGWEYVSGHSARLGAVTMDDLTAQMERCNGHEILTLSGPAEVITPQLDELGLEYEVFDWKQEADAIYAAYDPKGFQKAEKKRLKNEAKAAKKAAKGG